MSYNGARIESPELIKEFRAHYLKFDEACRQALAGMRSDAHRVLQWLRNDQLRHWKEELRRAEDAVQLAKSEYALARFGAAAMRKPSYIDEQKALKKAERRKEEAQRKIEMIKRWASVLEQQTEKMMGPVNLLATMLEQQTPKSIGKLDTMTENLEEYLRMRPPGSA